jgi:hypothetical protein
MDEFDGMIEMNGQQFVEWLHSMAEQYPDKVFLVKMETEDDESIPHEAYDMDRSVHFRRHCPHHNMHGTHDVELELDGHHVIMRGYLNGERLPGLDGEWPVVQRCTDNDDAMRLYLRARHAFVDHNFEIVDQ